MVQLTYGVTSRAYLARARSRLDDGTPEGLFYAAYELRCGIQSRLQEYLEARKEIAQKRREGWRIPQLAGDVERVFKSGDTVAQLSVTSARTPGTLVIYYTPVSRRLQAFAGRLGELLHAQPYRPEDDPFWENQRTFLEEVHLELKRATTGAAVGPPLINQRTGLVNLNLVFPDSDTATACLQFLGSPGQELQFRVKYLSELPADVTEGVAIVL
jgi:hypothetical protein